MNIDLSDCASVQADKRICCSFMRIMEYNKRFFPLCMAHIKFMQRKKLKFSADFFAAGKDCFENTKGYSNSIPILNTLYDFCVKQIYSVLRNESTQSLLHLSTRR